MNNSYITIIKEKRTALSRKRIPLNQNECTADFRIGVPFEQNLQRIPLNFNMQAGNCLVEKYKYDGFSNVSINTTQAFSNINPSDWNFSIGGYQPLQKYLKDRKGYILSSENIEHYEKIVWAIRQSQQLTKAIDIYIEL